MSVINDLALAMAVRFAVRAEPGDHDLGSWAKVEGLDVTWEIAETDDTDVGRGIQATPRRIKYATVTLTRAACADTKKVQEWLSGVVATPQPSFAFSIELYQYGASSSPIMKWGLKNALPLKWLVGVVDTSASAVAVETLEIVHAGFL